MRGRRLSVTALVAIGLGFFVAELAIFGVHLGFAQDEVDYLARVNPGVPELYWTPVRAWGMPLLALPVAVFSPGEGLVRLYFIVLLSAGLVLAFWPWCRVLRPGVAPLAALLFASTWVAVFFGSQVWPNLPVAYGCVAATGIWAGLPSSTRQRGALTVMTLVIGMVALVRPTDSVLLVVPLAAITFVDRRRSRRPVVAALVVGEAIGWVPWLIESFTTFGGPLARYRAANQSLGGSHLSAAMFGIYPRLFDNAPGYCCYGKPASTAGPASAAVIIWFVLIVVLSVAGVAIAARSPLRNEIVLVAAVAVMFILFYVGLLNYGTMRFLLPILALLSIPIALALVSAVTAAHGSVRPIAALGLVGLVGAHLALQADYGHAIKPGYVAYRELGVRVAARARPDVGRKPCLFVTGSPQIVGYYLGCHILDPRNPDPSVPLREIATARQRGWSVIAVLPVRLPGPYAFARNQHWVRRQPEPSLSGRKLFVYLPPSRAST